MFQDISDCTHFPPSSLPIRTLLSIATATPRQHRTCPNFTSSYIFQEILFRHGNPRSASRLRPSSRWNGVTSTLRSQLAGTRCRAMTSPSHPATTLLARPQHSNVSMMSAHLFDCPFWPTQTTTTHLLQARVQVTAVQNSSLQAKPATVAFRFHASSSSLCLAYDNARVCQK